MPRHPSKGKFYYLKKVIAAMLCVCMVPLDMASAAPARQTSAAAEFIAQSPPQSETQAHAIEIPEEFGTIEESWIAPSGERLADSEKKEKKSSPDLNAQRYPLPAETIIYIQDAHDSLEAQEDIAKIIEHLVENYGVKTVFQEGYEGPLEMNDYFGSIKDPEIKERVSYFLMDQLRINGAEYAHTNRKKEFSLIGVDNLELYRQNLEWYQKSAKHREETESDLKEMTSEIRAIADKRFSKTLKEWIKLKEKLDHKELDLLDYLKRIQTLFLKETSYEEFQSRHPNIAILLRHSERSEESLPAGRKGQIEILGRDAPATRLADKPQDDGEINPKTLFEEIDRFEDDYANTYLEEVEDRQTFHYYKLFGLLNRLNRIEVTEEEYEAVKDGLKEINTQEIAEFITEQAQKSLILSKGWEQNIQSAMQFYETARKRDGAIEHALQAYEVEGGRLKAEGKEKAKADGDEGNYQFQNLNSEIRNVAGLQPSTFNLPPAILVFGGFHKEHIKETLRENGLSYLVVTPKITEISPRHKEYYQKLMSLGDSSIQIPALLAKAARPLGGPAASVTSGALKSKFLRDIFEFALNAEGIRDQSQPITVAAMLLAQQEKLNQNARTQPQNRSEMRIERPRGFDSLARQIQAEAKAVLSEGWRDKWYLNEKNEPVGAALHQFQELFLRMASEAESPAAIKRSLGTYVSTLIMIHLSFPSEIGDDVFEDEDAPSFIAKDLLRDIESAIDQPDISSSNVLASFSTKEFQQIVMESLPKPRGELTELDWKRLSFGASIVLAPRETLEDFRELMIKSGSEIDIAVYESEQSRRNIMTFGPEHRAVVASKMVLDATQYVGHTHPYGYDAKPGKADTAHAKVFARSGGISFILGFDHDDKPSFSYFAPGSNQWQYLSNEETITEKLVEYGLISRSETRGSSDDPIASLNARSLDSLIPLLESNGIWNGFILKRNGKERVRRMATDRLEETLMALERLSNDTTASRFYSGLAVMREWGITETQIYNLFEQFPRQFISAAYLLARYGTSLNKFLRKDKRLDLSRLLAAEEIEIAFRISGIASFYASGGAIHNLDLHGNNRVALAYGTEREALLVRREFPQTKTYTMRDRLIGRLPEYLWVEFGDLWGARYSKGVLRYASSPAKWTMAEKVSDDERRQMKEKMGIVNRKVIVTSNRGDEGHQIVKVVQALPENVRPLVILGARYPVRDISKLYKELRFGYRENSDLEEGFNGQAGGKPMNNYDVVILNTFGELEKLFAVADFAILGEDRHPYEPIAQDVPFFFLPGAWSNNRDGLARMMRHGAAIEAREEFDEQLLTILNSPDELAAMKAGAERARRDIRENLFPLHFQLLSYILGASIMAKKHSAKSEMRLRSASSIRQAQEAHGLTKHPGLLAHGHSKTDGPRSEMRVGDMADVRTKLLRDIENDDTGLDATRKQWVRRAFNPDGQSRIGVGTSVELFSIPITSGVRIKVVPHVPSKQYGVFGKPIYLQPVKKGNEIIVYMDQRGPVEAQKSFEAVLPVLLQILGEERTQAGRANDTDAVLDVPTSFTPSAVQQSTPLSLALPPALETRSSREKTLASLIQLTADDAEIDSDLKRALEELNTIPLEFSLTGLTTMAIGFDAQGNPLKLLVNPQLMSLIQRSPRITPFVQAVLVKEAAQLIPEIRREFTTSIKANLRMHSWFQQALGNGLKNFIFLTETAARFSAQAVPASTAVFTETSTMFEMVRYAWASQMEGEVRSQERQIDYWRQKGLASAIEAVRSEVPEEFEGYAAKGLFYLGDLLNLSFDQQRWQLFHALYRARKGVLPKLTVMILEHWKPVQDAVDQQYNFLDDEKYFAASIDALPKLPPFRSEMRAAQPEPVNPYESPRIISKYERGFLRVLKDTLLSESLVDGLRIISLFSLGIILGKGLFLDGVPEWTINWVGGFIALTILNIFATLDVARRGILALEKKEFRQQFYPLQFWVLIYIGFLSPAIGGLFFFLGLNSTDFVKFVIYGTLVVGAGAIVFELLLRMRLPFHENRSVVNADDPQFLPEEDPSRSEVRTLAELLAKNYTGELAEDNGMGAGAKARRLAGLFESAVQSQAGDFIYWNSSRGVKLVEISKAGTRRYFDEKGRWILTLDRFDNKIYELAWNDDGLFESLWAMNLDKRIIGAKANADHLVREIYAVREGKRHSWLFMPLGDNDEIDFNRATAVPQMVKNPAVSAPGAGTLIFNVFFQLARDQGLNPVYEGNHPLRELFQALGAVATPSHPKIQKVSETFFATLPNQKEVIWTPTPIEYIHPPEPGFSVSVKGDSLAAVLGKRNHDSQDQWFFLSDDKAGAMDWGAAFVWRNGAGNYELYLGKTYLATINQYGERLNGRSEMRPSLTLIGTLQAKHGLDSLMRQVNELIRGKQRGLPFQPAARIGAILFDVTGNPMAKGVNHFVQMHAERAAILNAFEAELRESASAQPALSQAPLIKAMIKYLRLVFLTEPKLPKEVLDQVAWIRQQLHDPLETSILFVKLEPCDECTKIIEAAGIRHVVYEQGLSGVLSEAVSLNGEFTRGNVLFLPLGLGKTQSKQHWIRWVKKHFSFIYHYVFRPINRDVIAYLNRLKYRKRLQALRLTLAQADLLPQQNPASPTPKHPKKSRSEVRGERRILGSLADEHFDGILDVGYAAKILVDQKLIHRRPVEFLDDYPALAQVVLALRKFLAKADYNPRISAEAKRFALELIDAIQEDLGGHEFPDNLDAEEDLFMKGLHDDLQSLFKRMGFNGATLGPLTDDRDDKRAKRKRAVGTVEELFEDKPLKEAIENRLKKRIAEVAERDRYAPDVLAAAADLKSKDSLPFEKIAPASRLEVRKEPTFLYSVSEDLVLISPMVAALRLFSKPFVRSSPREYQRLWDLTNPEPGLFRFPGALGNLFFDIVMAGDSNLREFYERILSSLRRYNWSQPASGSFYVQRWSGEQAEFFRAALQKDLALFKKFGAVIRVKEAQWFFAALNRTQWRNRQAFSEDLKKISRGGLVMLNVQGLLNDFEQNKDDARYTLAHEYLHDEIRERLSPFHRIYLGLVYGAAWIITGPLRLGWGKTILGRERHIHFYQMSSPEEFIAQTFFGKKRVAGKWEELTEDGRLLAGGRVLSLVKRMGYGFMKRLTLLGPALSRARARADSAIKKIEEQYEDIQSQNWDGARSEVRNADQAPLFDAWKKMIDGTIDAALEDPDSALSQTLRQQGFVGQAVIPIPELLVRTKLRGNKNERFHYIKNWLASLNQPYFQQLADSLTSGGDDDVLRLFVTIENAIQHAEKEARLFLFNDAQGGSSIAVMTRGPTMDFTQWRNKQGFGSGGDNHRALIYIRNGNDEIGAGSAFMMYSAGFRSVFLAEEKEDKPFSTPSEGTLTVAHLSFSMKTRSELRTTDKETDPFSITGSEVTATPTDFSAQSQGAAAGRSEIRILPDYLRELREDLTLTTQILRHGGPLDIEGHIDFQIGFPIRSLAQEIVDEKLKAGFTGYYREQKRLMDEYREMVGLIERDYTTFSDAELLEQFIDLTDRYKRWLREADNFIHKTSNNIEIFLQQLDGAELDIKYHDDSGIGEIKKIYRRILMADVDLIKRDRLYLRALHSFMADPKKHQSGSVDVWHNLSNYLFKTKGLTGDNEFHLSVEVPQVPIPEINVDVDLFNLSMERLVSNAFIATQREGFRKKGDAIKKIRVQVVPTADFNHTQIIISNPSRISADELRDKLRLDPDRATPNHGIGLPLSVRAIEKMGGHIDVTEWDEVLEHRVGLVVTFPGLGATGQTAVKPNGAQQKVGKVDKSIAAVQPVKTIAPLVEPRRQSPRAKQVFSQPRGPVTPAPRKGVTANVRSEMRYAPTHQTVILFDGASRLNQKLAVSLAIQVKRGDRVVVFNEKASVGMVELLKSFKLPRNRMRFSSGLMDEALRQYQNQPSIGFVVVVDPEADRRKVSAAGEELSQRVVELVFEPGALGYVRQNNLSVAALLDKQLPDNIIRVDLRRVQVSREARTKIESLYHRQYAVTLFSQAA